MWSLKEQRAVKFSFLAHQGQMRKGKEIAYASHPLTVGLILARMGCDEDLVIAGILHDIIEDTDYEEKDIKKEFGERVAELVKGVTEEDKTGSWKNRKEKALEKLKSSPDDIVRLKAADLLSNMTDFVDELEDEGYKAFEIFSVGSRKKIENLEKLIKVVDRKLKNEAIVRELKQRLNQIKNYG